MGKVKKIPVHKKYVKTIGSTCISYGAPREVKVLVSSRNFLEQSLLSGMVYPHMAVYAQVVSWIHRLQETLKPKDLLTRDHRRGTKYRPFIEQTMREAKGWVVSLASVDPCDSCNTAMESYCPEHGEVHVITTEGLFAKRLVSMIGFMRCVLESTSSPIFEIAGEEDGVPSYLALMEEEKVYETFSEVMERVGESPECNYSEG